MLESIGFMFNTIKVCNRLVVVLRGRQCPKRAFRHFKLAARAGYESSINTVKRGFKDEFVTKDEYANTLHAYQKMQDEMKSDARDKAALFYTLGEWVYHLLSDV